MIPLLVTALCSKAVSVITYLTPRASSMSASSASSSSVRSAGGVSGSCRAGLGSRELWGVEPAELGAAPTYTDRQDGE